jgi:hypothetical protein
MSGRWRTQTTNMQSISVEACWRPMEGDLAGDFHEVIDLKDGRVAVVVGDAPGFGATAAALADDLRSQLREAFRVTDDAREVLHRLDESLCRTNDELLATVACAVIDPAFRGVHLANAGHLPPVFVNDSRAELLDGGGDPPLGIGADRRLVSHHLPGDGALFFYTDGLVERRGASLADALPTLLQLCQGLSGAEAWASELARRAAESFGDPADDATAVSVRLVDTDALRPEVTTNGPAGELRRERVVLHLYVDPRDLRSSQNEAVVRDLAYRLEDHLEVQVKTIDITAPGSDTETHAVLATPTVVRVSPEPSVRVIGGLRSVRQLARDLQLPLPNEER